MQEKIENNIDEDIKKLEKAVKVLTGNDTGVTLDFEGTAQAIENIISELETYKKIAEKLAEEYKKENVHYDNTGIIYCELHYENDYTKHGKCSKHNNGANCIQCIIDWARKEVEKDV